MEAGQLRHRVQWLSVTETATNGKITNTETSQGTFWAAVKTLSSTESNTSNKVQATKQHEVTMRYVGNIKQKDILVFNARRLQVTGVDNVDNRNIELIMTCVEVS